MDNKALIESFCELKDGFVRLIDAIWALGALSSLRAGSQSDHQLLESALAVLMQNQDLERCSVFMLGDDARLVNIAGLDWEDLIGADAGGERLRRKGKVFLVGEGLVGLAAETGELQVSAACATDERFMQDGCGQSPSVGSLIAAPIRSDDEMLGVLNVSHPHEGFFTESHLRTLAIFCNFLGQLLVSNRLLRRMDQLVDVRTRQLESALDDAQKLKRRYEALSVVDELTGLNNRRFFFPEARTALARSIRHHRPFALMLGDVDLFKQVNDVHGHAAGDEVLREIGKLMGDAIRDGDILARFGGEEFVIALPETDQEGALQFAERLREAISERSWRFGDGSVSVSISVGITTLAPGEEEVAGQALDRLLREADQALYFGKHSGRNQVNLYSDIACELGPEATGVVGPEI